MCVGTVSKWGHLVPPFNHTIAPETKPISIVSSLLTWSNLGCHVNGLVGGGVAALATSQILQETPMFHELSDDVDWLLQSADCVELEEVGVSQSLHHLSLLDEVIHLHRPWSWGVTPMITWHTIFKFSKTSPTWILLWAYYFHNLYSKKPSFASVWQPSWWTMLSMPILMQVWYRRIHNSDTLFLFTLLTLCMTCISCVCSVLHTCSE